MKIRPHLDRRFFRPLKFTFLVGLFRVPWPVCNNDLINRKDTKTKCRLYCCLLELIDWRYTRSCSYFRPSFVNYCISNLLSSSPPPPLHTVCGWEGGVLSCVGDHILQEFNTMYKNRFRTYKFALPPQTKT